MANLEYGATFTPKGGGSTHTYKDWGLYMGPPGYNFGAEKTQIVELPYSDEVLDYSNIYGRRFFNESKVTYTLMGQCENPNECMGKINSVQAFLRDFRGQVTDDMITPKWFKNARCTGFNFEANPASSFFTITIEIMGMYE